MNLQKAIETLTEYQKWRLGNDDIPSPIPKVITEALDVLINYHTDIMNETLSSQTEISDAGKDTADYIDRHIIESMKELAIEGFKPQTPEISDEEIEKAAAHHEPVVTRRAWISACKWYREQLKKK